jgi:hypothetical protein
MKTARTHGTHSLAASLHAAKPGVGQLPGQESFRSRLQGAIITPAGITNLAQRQASDKAKALKDGAVAEDAANALKAGAAAKKSAAANEAASSKAKDKHALKPGDEVSTGDAKTADGAGSVPGADAGGVPVAGLPGNVQPVQAAKKDLGDANGPAINSASTSTLQQAPLPMDVAAGPVEVGAAKQVETAALESKTKRVAGSAIAALSDKPTAGAGGADGLQAGVNANGIVVGGAGGQAMQGGHSSGSTGHNGQATPSHPAAGAGPQMVASSPSQLDVGVYDDTHGWLRIRAELGAGGAVNATVTSADAAHESLKTALPAMTHYLGTESVHVNSIELHKFGDTSGGQPGSHAEGQQQGSMTGQHASGNEQQQASSQANAMAILDDAAASRNAAAIPDAPSETEVEAVGAVGAVSGTAMTDAVGEVATAPAAAAGTESTTALAGEMDGDGQSADVPGAQFLPWQVGVGGSGGWVNVSA